MLRRYIAPVRYVSIVFYRYVIPVRYVYISIYTYVYIHKYNKFQVLYSQLFLTSSICNLVSSGAQPFGVMQLALVGTVPRVTRHAHFRQLVDTALVATALVVTAFVATVVAAIATTVDCRLRRN